MEGTATLLLTTLPSMPTAPEFPSELDWGWDDVHGLWTLDDAGTDALLDFRDNLYGEEDTRGFLFKLKTWKMQLDVVLGKITELGL